MEVGKFLKKQPLMVLLLLLLVLFLVFKPTIEGAENEEDSPWYCFLNFFGIFDDSCGGGEEEEEEEETSTPPASSGGSGSSGGSNSSNASGGSTSEPELPLCSCNTNCRLKNNSSDRVLDENCRIPEGVENITNVNGYCDACFDIVNTGCRSNTSENDPVLMADDWCEELGGSKITGANVLERCAQKDGNKIVPSGQWENQSYAEAYPKVLVNYMVNSTNFPGSGGKCENNSNENLRWEEYES